MRRGVVTLTIWAALALSAIAQEPVAPPPELPAAPAPALAEALPADSLLLVLDLERLFRDSAFGKASAARISSEQADLVAENRRLEAELEAEERELTARRATLPSDEFRTLAADFDAKAEEIRNAQAEKDRAIAASRQDDQQRFLQVARPELAQLMAELGGIAILDKQVVILYRGSIDITDRAIVQIDATLGDGSAPAAPAP
jgi:Skp family chaperone for outer membrane proteins